MRMIVTCHPRAIAVVAPGEDDDASLIDGNQRSTTIAQKMVLTVMAGAIIKERRASVAAVTVVVINGRVDSHNGDDIDLVRPNIAMSWIC